LLPVLYDDNQTPERTADHRPEKSGT
jgi:hypothetical protein